MAKKSKRYNETLAKVDRDAFYHPLDAVKLAQETSSKNYDATIDVAMRLSVDPRKADQLVRGTVNLPHGTGKTVRVAVFAEGENATKAEAAGADLVGTDALIGKASFTAEQLAENYGALLDEVLRLKPASAKGVYLKKVTVSATQGPGVPVDTNVVKNFAKKA